jgi:hypothetical protein
MKEESIKAMLRAINQRPIAYYPVYRDVTGSTTAAILLSQVLYWHSAVGRKFHKTDAEIMDETRLTAKELKGAKAILKDADYIQVTREGTPCKTHYDVDYNLLSDAILQSQKGQNRQTSLAKRAKLDGPKGPNYIGQKGQTLYTENTHRLQQEIESAPAEKTETAFDMFAPDAHEKTAAHIIAWLEANPHMIPDAMRGKDWKGAVKGHCLGLKKKEQEANLLIPKGENEHYKWIGRRIAGALSWFQVAAKFEKQAAPASAATAYTAPASTLPASLPTQQRRQADPAALAALKDAQKRMGL